MLKIHRKTHVPESFFNKVAGIRWLRLSKIFSLSQISYSLSADCLG